MIRGFALLAIGLATSSAATQPDAAPAPPEPPKFVAVGTFASAQACRVLEAAYTKAIDAKSPAFPTRLFRAERIFGLQPYTGERPWSNGTLTESEYGDLVARQAAFRIESFVPLCDWKAKATPYIDDEGHDMFVHFSNPVFSKDERLAMVEISFTDPDGGWGFGDQCYVRATASGWHAECGNQWIR